MRSVSYRLADLRNVTIPLGFRGENEHTLVIIDCKKAFDEYPRAIPSLAVKNPDGTAYPAVIVREGDLVYWDIRDSDLAKEGRGTAQLTFTEDGVVRKDDIFNTVIGKSILPAGPAPDPIADWIEEANRAIGTIEGAIETAQGAAEAAAGSATEAAGSVTAAADQAATASEYAEAAAGSVGEARNSAAAAAGSAETAQTAAETATQKATDAARSADDAAGYAEDAEESAEKAEAAASVAESKVREAVDEWLDNHPEATTTVDFKIATKVFSNVEAMIADTSLKNGDNVATRNYYSEEDNGGANYVISSSHSGVFYIELANGLYANRISEKGVLAAESIGIKAYSNETQNPDEDDMDRNVELFNTAHYNGIFLIFGKGHFYFSEPLRLANKGTHTVQGIDRAATILHFPNSNGLYFCDPRYYNYYVVQKMNIKSYGHCIVCDESCLTLLDSHFEWLILTSETGDCFHAPNYNVAKYVTQSGNVVYDTCVQNCVFDFINASAPQGAAFCNIMGMFTYYKHMNFVSCKYAFRNCDGIVWQTNTLGSSLEYFIYYDKVNSYSLRWMFIDVNAEILTKAFMFTEPEVQPAQGEDPRKPDTANIMAVNITAIRSGWSLSGEHVSDHDIYPITVHELGSIHLFNSSRIITPLAYPSAYDPDEVKAQINATRSAVMNYYYGGNDIYIFSQSSNAKIKYAGNGNNNAMIAVGNNGGYQNLTNRKVQTFSELQSDLIYGGKGLNVWEIKASDYNGTQINPPEEKTFFDTLAVNVDIDSNKRLLHFQSVNNSIYPGRIVTVHNRANSLHDLVLTSANNPDVQSQNQYMLSPKCTMDIRLAPGESVQLVYTIETNPANGSKIYVWEPIDKKFIQEDPRYELLYNAIKETSSKNILPVTKGYYIANAPLTGIDVNTLVEGKASNANYGIKNVLTACQAGDEFTIINGKGGIENTILWSFVSPSGNRLDNSGSYATEDNTVITAPANAAYLIVNSFTFPIVFKSN